MKHDILKIGLITSPHGIRGEINILPLTDDPSRFLKADSVSLLDASGEVTGTAKIKSARVSGSKVVGKIEGVDTPESARSLCNRYIAVDRENAVKLPRDSYFICDIIGCEVFHENGTVIGTITDIIGTGASDIYTVQRKGKKDLLIPAVKKFILNIDTDNGRIVVSLPEGLEEI